METSHGILLGWVFVLLGVLITLGAPYVDRFVSWFERGARRRDPSGTEIPTKGSPARGEEMRGSESLPVVTWAVSDERDTYLERRGRAYIWAVGGLTVCLGGSLWSVATSNGLGESEDYRRVGAAAAIVLGVGILVFSAIPYVSARSAYRSKRLARASAGVDEAITKACTGEPPLEIHELFQLNRRQLDEYQLLTRKQQRSAFLLAQVASVVAFAVLVGGLLVALSKHEPVDKYLTGGLSALGSVLSAFLAATFFRSHRDANKQMNRYYLEPQRTGRLLLAERLLGSEGDVAIKAQMIDKVLSWEMPRKVESAQQKTEPMNGRPPVSHNGHETPLTGADVR